MIFRKFVFLLSFLFILASQSFTQQNEPIYVIGDSLVGKSINGESIREVYGNVYLTQGRVVITCDKAIQFISRNQAELIGNVIATKDTLTIRTPRGFYFGNIKKTKSTSGVTLDDQKVVLTADSGEYYFNEDRAFFETNVKLRDKSSTLTSNKLTYYQQQNRALATGSVKIVDAENIITSDTLEHFRATEITFAFSNVHIRNKKNNTEIFGEHLEDYRQTGYTVIDVNPLLLQVDTTYTLNDDKTKSAVLDTLFISSRVMEAYRDSSQRFFAIDSVKILKKDFSSKNDYTVYFRNDDIIITKKVNETAAQPVIWNEGAQLTGDSITIYLDENNIKQLDVDSKSFMISGKEDFIERFDQTSCENIKIYFNDSKISRAEFYGNVYSIYYTFDGDEANGLTKSNAERMIVLFEDNKVVEVKLYKNPVSEYYPEPQVKGNERTYLLPKFILIEDKPLKEKMYNLLNELR